VRRPGGKLVAGHFYLLSFSEEAKVDGLSRMERGAAIHSKDFGSEVIVGDACTKGKALSDLPLFRTRPPVFQG